MATVQNISAAEAQSPESLLSEARALEPVVEGLLNRIRDVLIKNPPAVSVEPAEGRSCADCDRTDNRIRAFLASMRPLKGVCYPDDIDEANQRGRSTIERLAISAAGDDLPRLRLTPAQAADVLSFMASSEPVEPLHWWDDPKEGPSHLAGFYLLLQALEKSLRAQPVAESLAASRAFCNLQSRLMAILAQIQCADRVLWDLQDIPENLQPACITLHGAAEALDQFYTDLDSWEVHGAHTARQGAQEAVREGAPTAEALELPEALREHLQEQQTRVYELLSLLERLDEDDETPMCTRIAVRETEELARALDSMTLAKVLKAEGDAE